MIEKGYANSNDTDATHIGKPTDTDSTLAPSPGLFKTTATPASASTLNSYPDMDSANPIQLEIGSVIKNTFELVAVLGEGGMGTVFKALNKVWEEVEARDPYVAIKVLKPELSANKQLVRSLYSDFDRTKMLAECPNIIKVYGFDRDGPHVYMTMEYLNGQTLGEYLKREPMDFSQAWFIIEGIGKALAYAHKNNIVHRDIKPGNIIITKDGMVKVLDFGIASKINENEGDETKFGGHELGALTVAYAAPEMQRDFSPDARDDIYAFACVIYEILTGKQFYKQKINKAAPIRGLNSRQMDILNKSLAFERELRTSSIHELLDKLRPAKIPWMKYLGIGGGMVFIIGMVLWGVFIPTDTEDKQLSDAQAIQPPVVTLPSSPTATPSLTSPPTQVQPSGSTPVLANESAPVALPSQMQPPVLAHESAPEVAPLPASPSINQALTFSSSSSDGVVYLQTSKPIYKNGDIFHLSFTLKQPMYVRVIDRDAKGVVSVLRPNGPQPDKLLPANKKHSYPPKGFNAAVQGGSGNSTVTIVANPKPFSKSVTLLNNDGSVSEQVRTGGYSWTQIRYTVRQ
jgi:serine/threonine protein kinase